MASTFSPILRIELIGTGDQSGTWGNTTNVNLGTLIEQAIAGTATIDVTVGDVTLSNFNGTTDEARCAALRVTGTPGVSRNIVAPAVSKLYVVANGSDAAVVLKTSTSTGLTVPVGEVYLAYYDPTVGTADFRLVGRASATTNTANTLVLRDGSGNFAAGTITASLNGNLTAAAPTAPTPAITTDSTVIATTAFVRDIIPAGVILMWSGSVASIPTGWFLCNGSNGTPDLRNRFVVGAGSTYAVNATGGSADAIVVAHSHSASSSSSSSVSDPGHVHTANAGLSDFDGGPFGGGRAQVVQTLTTNSAVTGISVSTSTSTSIGSTGSSGTNANLPPYFALCFIMKS
jgi:microcystin-dependent protein